LLLIDQRLCQVAGKVVDLTLMRKVISPTFPAWEVWKFFEGVLVGIVGKN